MRACRMSMYNVGVVSSSQQSSSCMAFTLLVLIITLVGLGCSTGVRALPFPPPDFKNCNNSQGCCPPPYYGKIKKNYVFDTSIPMRIRRPAQLLDDAYIAQYQRAYRLLRALPDSDGRSWKNQKNLHCAYCNAAFYYPENGSKLEVHFGWLFFAWHRLYVYFHERILGRLVGDDTFALPFWNWDNQSPNPPFGNTFPDVYVSPFYNNGPSSLYDANRNRCTQPPSLVDFRLAFECANQTDEVKTLLRQWNNRIMFNQYVTGAPIPRSYFGQPYEYGSSAGNGSGTVEYVPHGTVHAWVGNPNATIPGADMGIFQFSAGDPSFFAHHGNLDRLWEVWKTLPGGNRNDIDDPSYLNSEFLFYDENGDLVKVKVAQASDVPSLRYTYEDVPNLWIEEGSDAAFTPCFATSPAIINQIICDTPLLSTNNFTVFSTASITFRVRRPIEMQPHREEVLVIEGLKFAPSAVQPIVVAFLYFPTANSTTPVSCTEFFGLLSNVNREFSPDLPDSYKKWRLPIGTKLQSLGLTQFDHIVVTLVQVGPPQYIELENARVEYDE